MRNFINISDLSKNELRAINNGAKKRKAERGDKPNSEPDLDQPIKGKTMIMLFGKPSTRTRVSFEVGVNKLGGQPLTLLSNDIQLGKSESVSDTAAVLSRYLDGITYRCFKHSDVKLLAENASVPVSYTHLRAHET